MVSLVCLDRAVGARLISPSTPTLTGGEGRLLSASDRARRRPIHSSRAGNMHVLHTSLEEKLSQLLHKKYIDDRDPAAGLQHTPLSQRKAFSGLGTCKPLPCCSLMREVPKTHPAQSHARHHQHHAHHYTQQHCTAKPEQEFQAARREKPPAYIIQRILDKCRLIV
jgi:hypothetical protein